MTEILLPCPFCGAIPKVVKGFGGIHGMQCECGAIVSFKFSEPREQAIAAWNRRVDAVPVVRGEWIVTDAYPHRVYCSLCYKTNVPNEEWLYEKNDYPKYCMWCGAKMEVEHETD